MINLFDLINGCFELGGAAFLLLNVKMIRRDKELKGIHWLPTIWFALWGLFNLFYYPHLEQWLSFIGGLLIVLVNIIWLGHILYYHFQSKQEQL